MKPAREKRLRKPRALKFSDGFFSFITISNCVVCICSGYLDASACRKLAAWLISAAAYLDQKPRSGKGEKT